MIRGFITRYRTEHKINGYAGALVLALQGGLADAGRGGVRGTVSRRLSQGSLKEQLWEAAERLAPSSAATA